MADDGPPAPATLCSGASKEEHAHAHQQEKARRGKVGYKAREEGKGIVIHGKDTIPDLALRVLLGDKVDGVIKGHEDDDQATERIYGKQARRLAARFLPGYGGVVAACL